MNFLRRNFPVILLTAIFILFTAITLLSGGYYGGADNISHYFISRYAFRYPHLFLDSWGRPLYTILSAPFAQFGLTGAKMFNVVTGTAAAWMAYRIASMFGFRNPAGAIVFVCFTPLYFIMIPTALTEVLFSFVLLLAIFLFLRGKYIASAIVISLLPFARSEGYFILPVFLFAFARVRQLRAIPVLASGILFFSILGSFHYKDLFWVIHQFPYPVISTHPAYATTGSFWHFTSVWDLITGLPVGLMLLAGVAGIAKDLFSKEKTTQENARALSILILLPSALYFILHSVLYWKGMGGSAGLERVLAAALPLTSIIALKGMHDLALILRPFQYLRTGFLILVYAAVILTPFLTYPVPYPLSPEEKTILKATTWLKSGPYADRLLFYTDNNVPFFMEKDPFSKDSGSSYAFGDSRYLDTIPGGSVLIWDAHFGPHESKIPLDSLLVDPRQKVIAYFRPDEPWLTLGGGFYDCYITLAINDNVSADNYAIRDSILTADNGGAWRTIYCNSFENPGEADPVRLSTDTVHRGKKAYRMDSHTEFSPGFYRAVSSLELTGNDPEITANVYVNLPEIKPELNSLLVISFENNGEPYQYNSFNLNDRSLKPGTWNRITLSAKIPAFISTRDVVKVYIWNPGQQRFYFDDLSVVLKSGSK